LLQLLSLSLAVPPCVILHHSEWIGNYMKTKIHLLWQHEKILQIHHSQNNQKPLRKFTPHEPICTYCEGPNSGQWCASASTEQPIDSHLAYLSHGIWCVPSN
jgi:hypothetical protein